MGVNSRRRGLQLLLELLIGLGLFVSVALIILIYLPVGDRATVQGDQLLQATHLARSLLDETLDQDYNTMQGRSGNLSAEHAERRGAPLVTEFTYNVEVSVHNAAQRIKEVRVRVEWRHGLRRAEVRLRGRKGIHW